MTYYERTLAGSGAEGEARLMEQWGTPEELAARAVRRVGPAAGRTGGPGGRWARCCASLLAASIYLGPADLPLDGLGRAPVGGRW